MNVEEISKEYKRNVEALIAKYGQLALWGAAPSEEVRYVTELSRARYVILANPDDPSALRRHALPSRIIAELGFESTVERPERRADKYKKIVDWCAENVYHQVTAEQIGEIGDFSYPTALKLIKERPDLFRLVKRGVYEVRDPVADRKEELEKKNA
jgi:hypothetical protein